MTLLTLAFFLLTYQNPTKTSSKDWPPKFKNNPEDRRMFLKQRHRHRDEEEEEFEELMVPRFKRKFDASSNTCCADNHVELACHAGNILGKN